jgi:hypothetical protein
MYPYPVFPVVGEVVVRMVVTVVFLPLLSLQLAVVEVVRVGG